MLKLSDFTCLLATPPMKIQVIDKVGFTSETFDAPRGFRLDWYVKHMHPENDLMTYRTNKEINISVIQNGEIVKIYRGLCAF